MALLFLLSFSLFLVSTISNLQVGVYWGQGDYEGSLIDACSTGNYHIVSIAYLDSFSVDQTPQLELSSHCNLTTNDCTKLSKEIKSCQALGIKIFLSIGGVFGIYTLDSPADATKYALYLWNNFLGGESSSRPLGDAVVDGIDFAYTWELSKQNRDNLATVARSLMKYNEQSKSRIYLSTSPECPFPNENIQPALNTGVFDYVWVQFYGDTGCDYSDDGLENLLDSWNKWTKINAHQVFAVLPADLEVSPSSGYIPPDVFRNQLLPELKRSSKFGGVILWSRAYDRGYSSSINPKVCGSARSSDSISDMAMLPMGSKFGGAQGFRTCKGICELRNL